jgi:protein-tyrosine phosphatase
MTTWEAGTGVIELPDGRRIRGRGLRDGLVPDGIAPAFGVYLTSREPAPMPWPSRWVRWPDFRLPTSTDDALAALVEAHARAESERVEIACGGGTGRTGTALAVIAILSGVLADEAVAWVRAHYRSRAVETPWQRRWVRDAARQLLAPPR